MKVLVLHVWRESELKSKKKMCSWEGILQFLLCHVADKGIKTFTLWTGLCFKSASQTLVNLLSQIFQKFLYSQSQSVIIFEVSKGFYLFILFLRAPYFEGQSSLFTSHSSTGIYAWNKENILLYLFFVVVVLLPVMETTSEINSYFGHCMLSIKLQSVEILSLVIFKTLIYVS